MRTSLFLLLAAWMASGAQAGESIERRAPADPRGDVSVLNVSGLVEVTGWDRPEVEVTGELGSGVERLEFETEGKHTRIKVIQPSSGHSSGSELYVKVPQGSSLSINTVSAEQTIRNVRGLQRLQAVSGDIKTEAWSEELEVKTVSGDVVVAGRGQATLITLTTVSGDAEVTKAAGELAANTVTGDLEISWDELTRGRIRTTNGDLRLSASLARDGRLDVETINGDVDFEFAGPINAEFDVETFNGDIDNCFGPEPERTSTYAPGRELRFRQGEGTGRVRIKTLNGGIRFCTD